MATKDLEVILDGADEEFLHIDATGVIAVDYPAEIKGSGLTENEIKALTNVTRNSLYVDTNNHFWLCTETLSEADPTAWIQVEIPIDADAFISKQEAAQTYFTKEQAKC